MDIDRSLDALILIYRILVFRLRRESWTVENTKLFKKWEKGIFAYKTTFMDELYICRFWSQKKNYKKFTDLINSLKHFRKSFRLFIESLKRIEKAAF